MSAPGEKRIVILAAGKLDIFTAKTAAGLLRYRRDEILGVLDPTQAGQRLEKLLGVGQGVPIVASLQEFAHARPDTLIIGIAPPGGKMPESWRETIREAIEMGMDIVSGLHTMLNEDAEFSALAKRHRVRIWDVRHPPESIPLGMALARSISSRTVLTVGSDCNLGKKICAIEMAAECQRGGQDAVFLPTGQTGVMITGRGMAIDRVISDFVAGAVESMVLQEQAHEWIFIEGQGAIFHPSYSGVTLGLLHGACPKAMVLCHQPSREFLRHTAIPIPSLSELIRIHESLLQPILPSKVVGVALNCCDLSDEEAAQAVDRTQGDLGLPVTDVLRFGAAPLVHALDAYFADYP